MFNSLAVRAHVALMAFASGLLTGTRRRVTTQARAVTFIEYALLAVVAVIIGAVFRTQLGSAFDTILGRIQAAMNLK